MLLQEVQRATSHVVTAATRGVMEASQSSSGSSGDLLEKLIAAFSSDKGSNLLTLAISVACRSSTSAWCEHQARQDAAAAEAGRPDNLQRLLSWAGASLLAHGCMQQSAAARIYCHHASVALQKSCVHTPVLCSADSWCRGFP